MVPLVEPGEYVPMMVTRAREGDTINGRAMLDGTDTLWCQDVKFGGNSSSSLGIDEGTWCWPPRV